MDKKTLFMVLVAVGIISIILGFDYLIPNTTHLLATSARHTKHGVLFLGIGIIAIIAAIANRKKV